MFQQNKVYNLKYHFKQSSGIHTLYLYDEVTADPTIDWNTWEIKESETSAEYFRNQLDAIPNTDTIHLHVNSGGGDVNEGVTIYNLLKQKSQAGCKIIGYVDGAAYSIAMDVIMACDEIHMGLGTSMFLHYPWTIAIGNADQLLSVAGQLEALGNASVGLYMARAKNLTEDALREMMAKETMLDPETCLQYGFCDVIDTYEKAVPEGEPEDDPDPDPDEGDEPEEPQEDEKDLQIKQLMAEIESLKAEKKPNVTQTLSKAFELLK